MERPRPLAGLPAADPRQVARRWLALRVAHAPLEDAPALAATHAELAPSVCEALLAALAADDALGDLGGRGAHLATLAGGPANVGRGGSAATAWDGGALPPPAAVLQAVEQLRGVVVGVLTADTDPALLPGLHDRLAHACVLLAEGALAPPGGIVVRDARPADPRGALTAEAERLLAAGVRFALLAVEVEDAAVLPAGLLAGAEAALQGSLPPGTLHAPDGPGSLLILARGVDPAGLARDLTRAVAAAGSHHGAPLRAAAGVARHPEDADTPEGLLARADGQLFAARADGLPLA